MQRRARSPPTHHRTPWCLSTPPATSAPAATPGFSTRSSPRTARTPCWLSLCRTHTWRAGDIADGDLLLAAVSEKGANYFNAPYTAHPEPFNPSCGCGVCCLVIGPSKVVMLSNGDPWDACDP